MGYLQEHRKFRHKLRSPVVASILLIIFLVITNSVWEVYKKDRVARINKETSEKQLADVTERKEFLTAQIKGLSTERGVEGELRSKYQITREGEQELVVMDEIGTTSQDSLQHNDGRDKSFWDSILGYFK